MFLRAVHISQHALLLLSLNMIILFVLEMTKKEIKVCRLTTNVASKLQNCLKHKNDSYPSYHWIEFEIEFINNWRLEKKYELKTKQSTNQKVEIALGVRILSIV